MKYLFAIIGSVMGLLVAYFLCDKFFPYYVGAIIVLICISIGYLSGERLQEDIQKRKEFKVFCAEIEKRRLQYPLAIDELMRKYNLKLLQLSILSMNEFRPILSHDIAKISKRNAQLIEFEDKAVIIKQQYPQAISLFEKQLLSNEEKINSERIVLSLSAIERIHRVQCLNDTRSVEQKNAWLQQISKSTSSWRRICGSVPYYHFYWYYPKTTFDSYFSQPRLPMYEKDLREEIWTFKNSSPEKRKMEREYKPLRKFESNTTKNIDIFNRIVDYTVFVLTGTFNSSLLERMVFLCLPASSKTSTIDRFEEFSRIVSARSGMINGFPYFSIKKGAISKHMGGDGQCEVCYDTDFFKEKKVLLFDDIVTTGSSMNNTKQRLEQCGATVVLAMSVAATTHQLSIHPITKFDAIREDRLMDLVSSIDSVKVSAGNDGEKMIDVIGSNNGMTMKGSCRIINKCSLQVGENISPEKIKIIRHLYIKGDKLEPVSEEMVSIS